MIKNMGSADKLIRVLIAFGLGMLTLFGVVQGKVATALLVVALVLLITSLLNFCPLYRLIGVNTCKVK